MARAVRQPKAGALVDEDRLSLVLGYLVHTGTAFFCCPGDEEDWLVTVDIEDGEELAAIDRDTRRDSCRVAR
jgi:hypothetical protein